MSNGDDILADQPRILGRILEGVAPDVQTLPDAGLLLTPSQASQGGTASVASARTGIDASATGVKPEVLNFNVRIPEHFVLAYSVLAKATWEITAGAGGGAQGRLIVTGLKNGAQLWQGASAVQDLTTPAVHTARIHADVIGRPPQNQWRRGDLFTLQFAWEVTLAGSGTFDASIHHDPDTAADRLILCRNIGGIDV